MKLEDFDYFLPEELIAQTPVEPRDSSRLMVVNKTSGEIGLFRFNQIDRFLQAGDVLVLNRTKVIPARLIGKKKETGAIIEVFLLKRLSQDKWETLVRPGRRVKPGQEVVFGDNLLTAELLEVLDNGNRVFRFKYAGLWEEILDKLGEMPLPPYIFTQLKDQARYQTVYAREDGSVAAPTAGLHFTDELLNKLKAKGVEILDVLLHVGLGTFRPVKTADIREHQMHAEYYKLERHTAERINLAKKEGRRIIAVGTTVVRTLETAVGEGRKLDVGEGWTDIFIYPGYEFQVVDSLITNFHLPRSTLLMLVSALAGRELILQAYETAIKERFRFFSFGDAMFIE
ncbi:MAG: tRNA preQ1(34) S-adenosylmethionine ribosyltransferase-isomerase QueA [Peptococcaceae bacterium]|nr:tRNA preQ1(34) S-adenosylmethionine ribosyltransferase-isomerase QueA [Peptococcaceae bacterium]